MRLALLLALLASAAALALLSRPPAATRAAAPDWTGPALELPEVAWTRLGGVGRLESAVRLKDAWAFVDPTGDQVLVWPDSAAAPSSFAGTGDGPGELRNAELLTVTADTLWVAHVSGLRFDAFSASGRFLRRIRMDDAPCPAPVLHALSSVGGRLVAAIQCFGSGGVTRHLVHVDPSTGRQRVVPWPVGKAHDSAVTLGRLLLGGRDGRLVLALSDHPCIHGAQASTPTCLDPATRRRLARPMRDSLEARLRPAARRLGVRLDLPTHEPYLDGLFVAADGVLVSRPQGEGRVLHPLGSGRGPHAWVLRLGSEVRPLVDGRHLLLVRNRPAGLEAARHVWAPAG